MPAQIIITIKQINMYKGRALGTEAMYHEAYEYLYLCAKLYNRDRNTRGKKGKFCKFALK